MLPWRHPAENIRLAAELLQQATCSAAGREALVEQFGRLVQTMLDRGHNLHDPRYIGHQVAASVPLAGLLDAVGSVTNQAMAIYDMGPWATAAEWAMVNELGRASAGAEGTFAGLATHGGSLANLTALLTARNVALGDCWQQGMARSGLAAGAGGPRRRPLHRGPGGRHPGTGHAAGGPRGARRAAADGSAKARRHARRSASGAASRSWPWSPAPCSTPIGAFDPLDDVADVCRRHGVWLHVDAAHGGAACLSPRHRHLVAGLDRADSVTWDAHKMLFVPALCAFVFYRDAAHRFEAFRQDAPYLFDPAAPGLAEFDSGLRTIECTKRAAAFGLWGIWSLFGPQLFADLVDITFALGRTFYEKLQAAPDFVPLHEPQCNIVVFRHVPERAARRPGRGAGPLPIGVAAAGDRVGRVLHRLDEDRRRRGAAGDDHQSLDHGGTFGRTAGDDKGRRKDIKPSRRRRRLDERQVEPLPKNVFARTQKQANALPTRIVHEVRDEEEHRVAEVAKRKGPTLFDLEDAT